jgi:uncharacterized protein
MPSIKVRLYAELNEHLPLHARMRPFDVAVEEDATALQVLEALKIPESEVDLILVNGEACNSQQVLRAGDCVSVYPLFESFDISGVTKVRPGALRQPRFVLDVHLGKLASFLRMLGFDTLYRGDYADSELVDISLSEERTLLSRDRALIAEPRLLRAYAVREEDPRAQLVEVLRRFDLAGATHPFTRCIRCNDPLRHVERQEVAHSVPPKAAELYTEFMSCPVCSRIFWKGSHYSRMLAFITSVLAEARGRAALRADNMTSSTTPLT